MTTLFYFGPNKNNVSGQSLKTWRVQVSGRTLTTWWGRAYYLGRQPRAQGRLATESWVYPSVREAWKDRAKILQSKLNKGYKPKQ
jgi:predicted DNA-binding WGR domain protein